MVWNITHLELDSMTTEETPNQPEYWRMFLGERDSFASQCFVGGWVGIDYSVPTDLTPHTTKRMVDQAAQPFVSNLSSRTKGIRIAALHKLRNRMKPGDYVFSSYSNSQCIVGRLTATDYNYAEGHLLPHRRNVQWNHNVFAKSLLSNTLRKGGRATLTSISDSTQRQEVDAMFVVSIPDAVPVSLLPMTDTIAVPTPATTTTPSIAPSPSNPVPYVRLPMIFRTEKLLADVLVDTWSSTPLGTEYDIYTDIKDGVCRSGRQFQVCTGRLDILAVKKDGTELLVIELKRGMVNRNVLASVQAYMGSVRTEVATSQQQVRGLVIAASTDAGFDSALLESQRSVDVPTIEVRTYNMSFRLDEHKVL
jgi:restriction system protein